MSRHRTPPSDREQLDRAFAHLAYKGYYTRARYWCCNKCALADIPDEYDKFVFWHEQSDAHAFGKSGNGFDYLSEEERQRQAQTLLEEGFIDDTDEFEEDDDEWKQHNTILRPLYLNWAGDAKEIITKLREFGFAVEFDGEDIDHVDPRAKIRVLPGRIPSPKYLARERGKGKHDSI